MRPLHQIGAVHPLQFLHAPEQPRFEVHHLSGVGEIARQLGECAVDHAGPDAEIALSTVVDGDEVRFSVADTGPGIPLVDQEAIFGRFARGAAVRRRSDGAGLGLAIVQAVAEAHGGRVDLVSHPGSGARFTIAVPRPATGTTPAPTPTPDPEDDATWPAS